MTSICPNHAMLTTLIFSMRPDLVCFSFFRSSIAGGAWFLWTFCFWKMGLCSVADDDLVLLMKKIVISSTLLPSFWGFSFVFYFLLKFTFSTDESFDDQKCIVQMIISVIINFICLSLLSDDSLYSLLKISRFWTFSFSFFKTKVNLGPWWLKSDRSRSS